MNMTVAPTLGLNMTTPYLQLGFPPLQAVETLRSIAHLFVSLKKGGRCGVYLLEFIDGTHYIGQAVDVVRRFAEHRRNHEITGFSFLQNASAKLNQVEQEKIHQAEQLGLRLINITHTTTVLGETDLDMIFPEKEQGKWLAAPARYSRRHKTSAIVMPESQQIRYAKRFRTFQSHPLGLSATKMLRTYLLNCIPVPRRTEYSFWNVSCLPTTNKSNFPRLLCVSAASMELLVLIQEKADPSKMIGFVTVATDALAALVGSPRAFKKRHPSIELSLAPYRDAGEEQITLCASDEQSMRNLLDDELIQTAAALLALRVMRKRAAFYAQYHCPQLASLALE